MEPTTVTPAPITVAPIGDIDRSFGCDVEVSSSWKRITPKSDPSTWTVINPGRNHIEVAYRFNNRRRSYGYYSSQETKLTLTPYASVVISPPQIYNVRDKANGVTLSARADRCSNHERVRIVLRESTEADIAFNEEQKQRLGCPSYRNIVHHEAGDIRSLALQRLKQLKLSAEAEAIRLEIVQQQKEAAKDYYENHGGLRYKTLSERHPDEIRFAAADDGYGTLGREANRAANDHRSKAENLELRIYRALLPDLTAVVRYYIGDTETLESEVS